MKHNEQFDWAAWFKKLCQKSWQAIHYFTKRFHILRWLLLIFLSCFLVFSAVLTFKAKTANVNHLKASLQTTTTIIDKNNQKAGSLYSQKGTYVSLDRISKNMQNAVIATEDRTFWTNHGFSLKGYARSFLNLLLYHQIMGGGSTLTQQLAKNALLTQKQTFTRKAEEFFLAVEINRVYSKHDILSMYLNNAYFGNGVWGVQDAAKKYFAENAEDLTPSQAATLAAMLRNPSFYDPYRHPDNSKSRRNLILNLMVQTRSLTTPQAKAEQKTAVRLQDGYQKQNGYRYPSYFDAVISEAESRYHLSEDQILNKGYKIYTSLDPTIQQKMQTSFDRDWLFPRSNSDATYAQGASIAIDPQSGGVSAVVGGRGQHVFRELNRATQTKRQPGSTMKPLAVYTPAIENGYQIDSMLPNQVTSFGKNHYTPTNADGSYTQELPLYQALSKSENVPAVALLDKIGVKKGVASVENFGIKVAKSDQNLALALGGLQTGVTPYQMARAYTAFANNGRLANTHFITKIVDATGAVVGQNDQTNSRPIMSKKTAQTMTSLLLNVFNQGTGATAKPTGYQVAGKTGSTEVPQDYGNGTKDQWIVGYTPDIVVATWVGFDKTDRQHFIPGSNEQGVAPLFKNEMANILPETKQTSFKVDDASTIVQRKKQTSPGKWTHNFSGNLRQKVEDTINNFNNAKQNVSQWYNQIKGHWGQ
ncbi:PBP1A family penicillin-binding protein [Bombilactobacillus folatiphilus]|uniref:PBP1A family penicillin-binding protein n=1 Tax=Bombilactobacillus folatiphilus TaxID=2923362 RepID=A0ABY4PAT8_9LACO|nr:PBP1A family penicillin-binding protein [Bombilactobacillus folatiphilus]UQS82626.1 PBP1A family penicillin-binding protein [Bombilactobacillus folatiphilus]